MCGHSLFPQSSKVFCFTNALQKLTLPFKREEKIFLILQRANQNTPYYVCDASNPLCGHEFSFSSKTGGWHGQYIQHTGPLKWGTFLSCLLLRLSFPFLALVFCDFQTSVLPRTNQKLHFTNVPLSRLRGGCGYNEGLQRCETDMQKWIIRTESFCDANDTRQEIGSLSSMWNRCAAYLYNFPRPIQSFHYNFSFHYDQALRNSRCSPYLCFREMSECRDFNYLCNYLRIYFA